jgi:prevent-host-death family protein
MTEARATLTAIVDEVCRGKHIELTRRGRPVAVMVPVQEYKRLRSGRPGFTEAYRRFLDRFPLHEVGLEARFIESLRAADPGRDVLL